MYSSSQLRYFGYTHYSVLRYRLALRPARLLTSPDPQELQKQAKVVGQSEIWRD